MVSEGQIQAAQEYAALVDIAANCVPVWLDAECGQKHSSRSAGWIRNRSPAFKAGVLLWQRHPGTHLGDRFRRHELLVLRQRDTLMDVSQEIVISLGHLMHEQRECFGNCIDATFPRCPLFVLLDRLEVLLLQQWMAQCTDTALEEILPKRWPG